MSVAWLAPAILGSVALALSLAEIFGWLWLALALAPWLQPT